MPWYEKRGWCPRRAGLVSLQVDPWPLRLLLPLTSSIADPLSTSASQTLSMCANHLRILLKDRSRPVDPGRDRNSWSQEMLLVCRLHLHSKAYTSFQCRSIKSNKGHYLFFYAEYLRWNLHARKHTESKCTIQWISGKRYTPVTYAQSRTFHISRKFPIPFPFNLPNKADSTGTQSDVSKKIAFNAGDWLQISLKGNSGKNCTSLRQSCCCCC